MSNEIILNNTDKKNIKEIPITSSNTNYNFEESMSSCCFNLDLYKKISLNPLGLKNPSIYCYMNCCLQILLSIPELNYYFLNKRYNKNEQGQNNRTLICNDYSNFISLYQYYINNKEKQMDLPSSMFEICNNLVPKNVMNDCEEFLILLLQSIQEELNYNSNQNNINNNRNINNNNNNNNDKNDIEKKWCLYRERNSSFMDSIFTGYLRSTVICEKCNKPSYSYEPFMDLSVPVPKTNKSVNKCLNRYFEAESIDCNYHCENCNSYTKVSHKILINNLLYLY
jgi:ubiquitin C-terminal hydrolase